MMCTYSFSFSIEEKNVLYKNTAEITRFDNTAHLERTGSSYRKIDKNEELFKKFYIIFTFLRNFELIF